jgi:transcriptional regulator with XRE-family HTH domain
MRDGDPIAAIDRHVSARIRERRVLLGMTQQALAEKVGVTYQQEHKYERGVDRISAGRLFLIAQALGVSIDYFYTGLEDAATVATTPHERRTLEIVKLFGDIADPVLQEALANLTRILAVPSSSGKHGG